MIILTGITSPANNIFLILFGLILSIALELTNIDNPLGVQYSVLTLYFSNISTNFIGNEKYILGIEYAANLVIEDSIAVYDNTHEVIGIFYLGNMQEEELIKELRDKIPSYMMPDKVIKIERITYNANGKKDRNYYKKTVEDLWIK